MEINVSYSFEVYGHFSVTNMISQSIRDIRNAFDVEKYLEHKLVFSQDTEFEVYEVNVTEEDVKAVIEEEVN